MTLSLGSIFSFWKSADATRGQQFTWIFIQKRVLGLFFFDSVKQFIFHHLSHDSVQNLGGNFARVFGGLAQFVFNFFVTRTFAVNCVTASWHVVVPWLQFFGKITNLSWKIVQIDKNFVTKAITNKVCFLKSRKSPRGTYFHQNVEILACPAGAALVL